MNIRKLILGILFLMIFALMFQLDIPTLQTLPSGIVNQLVERQLQLYYDDQDLVEQGWMYYNLGQYQQAQKFMNVAYKKDNNLSALYCLGLIDLKYRKFEDGIDKLDIVAQKSPEHTPTKVALGKAYFNLHYYIEAKKEFKQAVKLDPANEDARLWLGKTYLKLNNTELALNILETVLDGEKNKEASALIKNLR